MIGLFLLIISIALPLTAMGDTQGGLPGPPDASGSGILPAPQLSVTVEDITATFTWNAMPGALGYKFCYDLNLTEGGTFDGEFLECIDVGDISGSIPLPLWNGIGFHTGIKAYNNNGDSEVSNVESFYIGDSSTTDTPDSTTDTPIVSGVVYVNAANTGGPFDGTSWATAYPTVSEGLAAAVSGNSIWVAAGTYYTTSDSDRSQAFTLVEGVSLYGGFGGMETQLSERNWTTNETILSGNIGDTGTDTDNAYHVVRGASNAVIDGFIIEKGYAMLVPGESCPESGSLVDTPAEMSDIEILRIVTDVQCASGGGMYNVHVAPTIRNCTFRNNFAAKGGGVYNMVTTYFAPGETVTGESPYFENVTFSDNTATGRGGAINNDFSTSPTFLDVKFFNNHCDSKGGAIYNDMGCSPYIINALFVGNTSERGSALVHDGSSQARMAYITVVGNEAFDIGAALYQGTYGANNLQEGMPMNANEPHVYNSIVIGNSSAASSSSISNWMYSILIADENSMIETTDHTLDQNAYLGTDYVALSSTLGWAEGRDYDKKEWFAVFDADANRIYSGYSYTTDPTGTGSGVIYVKADATAGGDGSAWATAKSSLAEALANAASGQEIWVAAGTYYPTTDTDRTQAFVLKENVAVYGGFTGSETSKDARDPATNTTILSGDIGVKDTDTDNAFHVVFGASNAILDGFTIEKGFADGDLYNARGGGILNMYTASPTLSNCIIQNNYALEGGGLAAYKNAMPTLSACTFSANTATNGAGALFRDGSSAVLSDTTFTSNIASDRGGAVYIDYGASPAFTRCTFTGNSASGNGGGAYIDDNASQVGSTEPTFTECTFTRNTSSRQGGGIAIYNSSCRMSLASTTISGNQAGTGGGGVSLGYSAQVYCSDCTISGNSSDTGEADLLVADTASYTLGEMPASATNTGPSDNSSSSSSSGQAGDLADAAAKLGITEKELQDALGPPPPDTAAAAATLGITEAELKEAMGIP